MAGLEETTVQGKERPSCGDSRTQISSGAELNNVGSPRVGLGSETGPTPVDGE